MVGGSFSSWPLLLNGWTAKTADICPGGPIPGAGLSGVRWQCPFHLMVTESRYFVPVRCLGLTQGVVPGCHVWHLGRWMGPGLQLCWFGPKAGPRPGRADLGRGVRWADLILGFMLEVVAYHLPPTPLCGFAGWGSMETILSGRGIFGFLNFCPSSLRA